MGLSYSCNILLGVAAIVALGGCRDWRHHKGYKIIGDPGDEHRVVHASEVVVGPTITHWGIYKDFLLVYKEAHDGNMKWADQSGYVIIDTSDGTTTFSATKKEYQSILVNDLGVPAYETELQSIFPFGTQSTPEPDPVDAVTSGSALK